jgi:uncharacterized membrane protein YhaH (DUF805 family)
MADWTGSELTFLYRRKEGTIGRRAWILASLPPNLIVVAMTLVWIAIMPRTTREPSQGLVDFGVAARYFYLVVYAFAVLICAVAQYFVSAKRFADLGKPAALAGVAPFAIFFAAAAHWYVPRSEGWAPYWLLIVFDLVAAGSVIWNIAELGFLARRNS